MKEDEGRFFCLCIRTEEPSPCPPARFYDAENHRFTQQDPAKYGANWYVYGGNNPVNTVDPMGLRYLVVDGSIESLNDNAMSRTGNIWIRELVDTLKRHSIQASVNYDSSLKRASGRINNKYYSIDNGNLNVSGNNYAGYDNTNYFQVINCTKQNKFYVDLTKLMEYVGLSGRVMWLSSTLEQKVMEGDIGKGVKVVVSRDTQYLDVTIPVTTAIESAEPTFEAHKWDFDWFKAQVDHNADWDIKRAAVWPKTIGTTFPGFGEAIAFRGELITVEILGNMTYGYLGQAIGFAQWVLLFGGDYAAGGIGGLFTSADSPEDKAAIRKGVDWYNDVH